MLTFDDLLGAWHSITSNKLRSALTLLGMVIGVFSVIASVTAVGVLDQAFTSSLSSMGSTVFKVERYGDSFGPQERDYRRPITYEQAVLLQERAQLAVSVSPTVTDYGEWVRFAGERTDATIRMVGTDQDFAVNNNFEIARGRFINEADVETGRAVVVLGSDVYDDLFEGREALGQQVSVSGRVFTVVGVLEEQSGAFGFNPNSIVVAPISRAVSAFGLQDRSVDIDVKAPSVELISATKDEVIGLMRAIRRVPPGADNDFDVASSEALAEGFSQFTNALALGGAGIGLIALLAAGIGVMNIMLVSVTERTREIGVRKALGATRGRILRQFLVEAVLLCQVGGLLGIAIGVIVGNLVAIPLDSEIAFPWGWAAVALVGMVVVAVGFGVYPAWKAARLQPVEALRYE